MHVIKKVVSYILILATIFLMFSGCSPKSKNTVKVSQDNTTASSEGVSITFSPYDLEQESTVEIKSVEPQPIDSQDDLSEEYYCEAYDFKLEGKEEFMDLIDIVIPYEDGYIDEGQQEELCVSAMYFNEEEKIWEPVEYYVDDDNNSVYITTSHLSTYGVFVVKNENTRAAKIVGINTYAKLVDSTLANEIINECLESQMTPGAKALELGTSITGDWLGIGGASITALTQTVYSTEFLNNLGGAMTNIGLAAAFAQAVVDFRKGDDVALYGNLTKNLSYYSIGTWGSRALQLSFVGVYAIDYSINKFASEAWNGRNEIWYEAYKIYYETEGKRSASEWYKKFYWMWQDSISSNNPNELKDQINQALDEYCRQFWNLSEEDIAYYQSEAMKTGFSGGGGLNEALRTEIMKAKKAELVEVLQATVFDRLESKISLYIKEQYYKELEQLKNQLNQIVNVNIVEEVAQGETSIYAGYTIRFAPLNENAIVQNWTGKLKSDGSASTKFRVLGHIQSGCPNTLELYSPDKDPNNDEPDKVVTFKVSIPETTIEIKSCPPFEEILGNWNGNIFMEKVEVPENTDTVESIEGCDINILAALKEMEGQTRPLILKIEKTGENTGVVRFSDDGDFSDADPISVTYDNGHLSGSYGIDTATLSIDLIARYISNGISLEGYIKIEDASGQLNIDAKFTGERSS